MPVLVEASVVLAVVVINIAIVLIAVGDAAELLRVWAP